MRTTKLATSILISILAFGMAGVSFANENPELTRVAAAVRPVLEKFDIKADITFANPNASLLVSYRTQSFKIHARSMTGEISPVAHDETGPSFKGFVLRVHLQDKGEVNQAVTPQTLQEPYWQTNLEVTPLGGTQKQIYWALSFGSRTDAKLLEQLRKAMKELDGAPAK